MHPDIYGAKISGAGLGDCVIGLGNIPNDYFNEINEKQTGIFVTPPLRYAEQGLIYL